MQISYQGVCERRVEPDGAAGQSDGQPRPDGGGGDGARRGHRGRNSAGGGGGQGLLAAEQRLPESGEAFLQNHNTAGVYKRCGAWRHAAPTEQLGPTLRKGMR